MEHDELIYDTMNIMRSMIEYEEEAIVISSVNKRIATMRSEIERLRAEDADTVSPEILKIALQTLTAAFPGDMGSSLRDLAVADLRSELKTAIRG